MINQRLNKWALLIISNLPSDGSIIVKEYISRKNIYVSLSQQRHDRYNLLDVGSIHIIYINYADIIIRYTIL